MEVLLKSLTKSIASTDDTDTLQIYVLQLLCVRQVSEFINHPYASHVISSSVEHCQGLRLPGGSCELKSIMSRVLKSQNVR